MIEKKLSEYNFRVRGAHVHAKLPYLRLWLVSGAENELVKGLEVRPQSVTLLEPLRMFGRRKILIQGDKAKSIWDTVLKEPLLTLPMPRVANTRSVDAVWLLVELHQPHEIKRFAFNDPWSQKLPPDTHATSLYKRVTDMLKSQQSAR